MDDNPFAEERWQADLAHTISEHELDQLAGVDADELAEFMALVAGSMVRLIVRRDRGMPEALHAEERAELAALRKANKLQATVIAQRERDISDLNIRLADLQRLRDYERD